MCIYKTLNTFSSFCKWSNLFSARGGETAHQSPSERLYRGDAHVTSSLIIEVVRTYTHLCFFGGCALVIELCHTDSEGSGAPDGGNCCHTLYTIVSPAIQVGCVMSPNLLLVLCCCARVCVRGMLSQASSKCVQLLCVQPCYFWALSQCWCFCKFFGSSVGCDD